MSLALIAVLFIILLALAYFLYGAWVARVFGLDDTRPTPAHTQEDGVDYVPTKPFYLFAQHFSAIAAAGPIAGPIVACQQFGWLPCLLWISLGVVTIGAVHDFATLALSVRHGANSIAEISGSLMGKNAGRAMMGFIWIALLYIVVAFTDITAASFVSRPEELQGVELNFHPGGAVAWASIAYMLLSVVLGFVERYLRPPLWLITLVFVPLTFLTCWIGTYFSHWFIFDGVTWALLILAYCAVASVIPVWMLLQPRGYLGGFVLYSALAIGVIGIFFGDYTIQQPALKEGTGLAGIFPFLFVTIACGACSGFHGLVCSGTTSKQIDKECDTHAVGYGAMLAEGFVALIALAVIMVMAPSSVTGLKPGTIYGRGIGEFLTLIIGKDKLPFAITFGAMAFSTFVFDTLDVSTRLGRYLIQELTGMRNRFGAIFGTLITLAIPAVILATMQEGSWTKFWTLFGASNQLLAALSLMAITLWLYQHKKRIAFTLIPMLFVLTITFWALIEMTRAQLSASQGLDVALVNALASGSLLLLAMYLILRALRSLRTRPKST